MRRIALISLMAASCAQVEPIPRGNNPKVSGAGDAGVQQVEPDRSQTQIPAEVDPPPADVDPT